ncbi:MAG: ABC transporter substrate-binding protein [Methylococcales bacterium]|jgi:phospholipid transport system substrate-binding protein|nr:ABC transporter substrate-binding protein [Methylococcales bacterium]
MNVKRYTLFGFFSVLIALISVTQVIAADLLPPQQAIETASAKLQQKMQDKSFIKDFAKVNQFVNDAILPSTDFDKISALVLGKLWKTATPEERERFKHEFQTLLVRTYSRAFIEFKDWSIRYLPIELEAGATKVIVKTEVIQPSLQPVAVDYRMLLSDGQWKAYDIMIEGVSLVTNYRTTFTTEVQAKGSLSAVIDGLQKRNSEALLAKNS